MRAPVSSGSCKRPLFSRAAAPPSSLSLPRRQRLHETNIAGPAVQHTLTSQRQWFEAGAEATYGADVRQTNGQVSGPQRKRWMWPLRAAGDRCSNAKLDGASTLVQPGVGTVGNAKSGPTRAQPERLRPFQVDPSSQALTCQAVTEDARVDSAHRFGAAHNHASRGLLRLQDRWRD